MHLLIMQLSAQIQLCHVKYDKKREEVEYMKTFTHSLRHVKPVQSK
jgi:hypothetical protein